MRNKKSNKAAFTLLEVLIVVLILGILATLAMPSFQGLQTKAKFARALTVVSRMEREIELILLEDGWAGLGSAATERLNAVLVNEVGATFDVGYYKDSNGVFAYSAISFANTFASVSIYAQEFMAQPICTRCYFKPGTSGANLYGEKSWIGYPANPEYEHIKGLLEGQINEF